MNFTKFRDVELMINQVLLCALLAGTEYGESQGQAERNTNYCFVLSCVTLIPMGEKFYEYKQIFKFEDRRRRMGHDTTYIVLVIIRYCSIVSCGQRLQEKERQEEREGNKLHH